MNKQEVGKLGEEIAIKYLQESGYEIIKKNYYTKYGEIDIIAKQNNEIVFIEVKTRCNNLYGTPAESVDLIKKKHMYKVAKYFLYKTKQETCYVRFDVFEIYIINKKLKIKHIKQIM